MGLLRFSLFEAAKNQYFIKLEPQTLVYNMRAKKPGRIRLHLSVGVEGMVGTEYEIAAADVLRAAAQ
jgi:hypothetical protein